MIDALKPSRPARSHGFAYRLGWWICRGIVIFLAVSVGLTLLYKFVPVPYTLTMAMDPNPVTKDWTSLDAIDRNMVDAAIAGEDGRFCSHSGFDTDAMKKAFERNMQGGRIRGGSTISQQTAKNVFLWQGGGYFRKGLEAWFTVLIEQIWGKRRIMEVYLNVAETGIGTYGVEAGAQRYYNKPARSLSRVEAARIAAAFPQPKVRAVTGASGFTLRHGNAIARRVNVVRGDYDSCVYR
ncbi:monofunctional biosynthetic peptidoglycan transglycosylase [Novosphingobium sp. KCTC 2891]|uniref:monofunctional biosynthetic peptidoglycan transglycosylase n=1 Tax=Novosphingobium sp. KCTC 2891 TaxID=2989730 RepID=UPI002221764E|nr:monofunctional biosynthetic peptidoglycan transglycosylase [Novosphingobium sp. KCTC 2891]MCW1382957.1 monofunctional biosynthetic peptidoglycan transglycosylase [Novosphingobium sp. KCTC 2891]